MSEEIKDIRNDLSDQAAEDAPALPSQEEVEAEKKAMRRCFSRCGWASVVIAVSSLLLSVTVGIVIGVLGVMGIKLQDVFQSNMLYLNEVLVGLALLISALLVIGLPKSAPQKKSVSVKFFFALLCVSFFASTVGNLIGTRWLSLLELFTGSGTENQLTSILNGVDIWQMIICAVIIAPLIEELFFRKLLIDRMAKYGETAAILSSALLFALFHQNLAQFFYTFGMGVIWGYAYCKTGSYKLVSLLHMATNFIGGVLPSLILTQTEELIPLLNAASDVSELFAVLFGEYGLLIVAYVIYLFASLALNIGGIAVLLMNFKNIKLESGESILTAQDKKNAAVRNSGMIVAVIALAVMSVIAVF